MTEDSINDPAKRARTRFAPSPTGFMHVGGMRTALFAWLVARQSGGEFILRLEDTDQKRQMAGAETHISKSLNALGLNYDEGPDKGGPFGPYRQSERLDVYKRWAQKLIDAGRAYADPYSNAEVQAFRDQAQKDKQPFLYRDHRPENPPVWDGLQPLRFKSDPKAYRWHDAVMGDLATGPKVIDDFVLIKSDGFPTYNFSHIVDDAEMKISHIIRGQEFLASTPNYLNLYEALGISRPEIATVPHILAPAGNKKLSKRDGAKDVLDYINDGFLPAALINFIASLGWNDGTQQEIFSIEELKEKFSLSRVQKSGARFDERRLLWMNGHYIRDLKGDELKVRAEKYWPEPARSSDNGYKTAILGLIQERLKYFAEIPSLTEFFFEEPKLDDVLALYSDPRNKLTGLDPKLRAQMMQKTITGLQECSFTKDDIRLKLNDLLQRLDTKPGILFSIIRIAITGTETSPELFGTMEVLGKQRVLIRLGKVLPALEK